MLASPGKEPTEYLDDEFDEVRAAAAAAVDRIRGPSPGISDILSDLAKHALIDPHTFLDMELEAQDPSNRSLYRTLSEKHNR